MSYSHNRVSNDVRISDLSKARPTTPHTWQVRSGNSNFQIPYLAAINDDDPNTPNCNIRVFRSNPADVVASSTLGISNTLTPISSISKGSPVSVHITGTIQIVSDGGTIPSIGVTLTNGTPSSGEYSSDRPTHFCETTIVGGDQFGFVNCFVNEHVLLYFPDDSSEWHPTLFANVHCPSACESTVQVQLNMRYDYGSIQSVDGLTRS